MIKNLKDFDLNAKKKKNKNKNKKLKSEMSKCQFPENYKTAFKMGENVLFKC